MCLALPKRLYTLCKVIVNNIMCYVYQPYEREMHDSAYETVFTSDSLSLSGCELLHLVVFLVLLVNLMPHAVH